MTHSDADPLSASQARWILDELARLETDSEIEPMAAEELALYLDDALGPSLSPEREQRQRQFLEELHNTIHPTAHDYQGLTVRARETGWTLESLGKHLRLDAELLLNIDLGLVRDIPRRLVATLATMLELDEPTLASHLIPRDQNLEAIAAASKGQPAPGEPQTWRDLIESSQLDPQDKAYWLS